MTEWLLMDEALDYLKIQEFSKFVYGKKLESLHKHGKIRGTRLMGIRYYDRASLDALREANATGKICAASQDSTNLGEKPESSSPTTGISSTLSEATLNASLRGIALARKTMKQTSRSHSSRSNVSGQSAGSHTSL